MLQQVVEGLYLKFFVRAKRADLPSGADRLLPSPEQILRRLEGSSEWQTRQALRHYRDRVGKLEEAVELRRRELAAQRALSDLP